METARQNKPMKMAKFLAGGEQGSIARAELSPSLRPLIVH